MGFFEAIGEVADIIAQWWEKIRKIILAIVRFMDNLVAFFKQDDIREKLKNDKDLSALIFKEEMENGNIRILQCLYDNKTQKVLETNMQGIETKELDSETKGHFKNDDLIEIKLK
ncbi:hypothetical protein DCO58_08815 [Helicobacter saguini]|uniref:Uncharacterized protein n=1 Tax=Helicobacter saguini TaxID=1548018 RepID=A0A347VNZ0_9HELI|nr:hypothetical protein [Helicobacter saguini]MWV61578.1 hypothetical protein [Helicobacter saguini]MWV67751.1 hypothetical protein [Helicobacter saguini]MWV70781.1 hypothetical protein [Helicobacter saguini]MWV72685.1 hypothetical protein [Helicobacter saguini]TLD94513.1 hypothetical protein LS64_004915 [Helicobacter saguini]